MLGLYATKLLWSRMSQNGQDIRHTRETKTLSFVLEDLLPIFLLFTVNTSTQNFVVAAALRSCCCCSHHFFFKKKSISLLHLETYTMVRLSAFVFALLASSTSAFAPTSLQTSFTSNTELSLNRRDVLQNVGLIVGGVVAGAAFPEESSALSNPALETFKGRKPTKGAFIPGKLEWH